MEPTFSNYANNYTGMQYPQQNIQAVNSNINVVINNQNITPNSSININNNILVINKFQKEEKEGNKKEIEENNHIEIIENNVGKAKLRYDSKGIEIKPAGKHKISFKDKVTNKHLAEYHNIESFKEYNHMENVSTSNHQNNSCCMLM